MKDGSFNADLLYKTADDITVFDPDALEDYREARTEKPISRIHDATINYDHLQDDMIFPS